jgi:hypothetical protein
VDHSCQQCGVTIEDGRPFCPQCRAPQIHVQVAVAEPPASASLISPDGLAPGLSLEPTLPAAYLGQAARGAS